MSKKIADSKTRKIGKIKLTKRGKGCVELSTTKMLPAGCEGFAGYFNKCVWRPISLKKGYTSLVMGPEDEKANVENSTSILET